MIKMKLTDVFKDRKGREITDLDGITPLTLGAVMEKYAFNLPPSIAAKIMHKPPMFICCGLRCSPPRFPFGSAVMERGDGTGKWSYSILGNKFLEYLGITIDYGA